MDALPLAGLIVPSVLGIILVAICIYFLISVCYKKWKNGDLEDDTEALTSRDEVDSVDYTFSSIDNPQCQQQHAHEQDSDQSSVSSTNEVSIIVERVSGGEPHPEVATTTTLSGNNTVPQSSCGTASHTHKNNAFDVNQFTVVEINTRTSCGNNNDPFLQSESSDTPTTPSSQSSSPSSSQQSSSTSWATAGTSTPTQELPLHFDNIFDLALAGSLQRSKSLPASGFPVIIANDAFSSSSSPIPKAPYRRRLDFQDDSISIYEERDCQIVKVKRPRHSFITYHQTAQNLGEQVEFDYLKKCNGGLDEWATSLLNVFRNCGRDFSKTTNLLEDKYVSASFIKEAIKCLQDIQEEKDLKIIYLAQKLLLHKQPRNFGFKGFQKHPPLIIGVDATKDHMAGYLVNMSTKVIKFYVVSNAESPWIIFNRFCPIEFEMKNFLLALCICNKDIVDHGKFTAYTDNTGVNSSLDNYGCWVQELLKHFTSCKNALLVNQDSYVNRRTDLESFAKFIQPADDLSRFEIESCVNFRCDYYFIEKENVTGTHIQMTKNPGQKRYKKTPYCDLVLKTEGEFINSFECTHCKKERLNLSLRDDLNIQNQSRRCSSLSPPKSKRKKRNKSMIFLRSNSST